MQVLVLQGYLKVEVRSFFIRMLGGEGGGKHFLLEKIPKFPSPPPSPRKKTRTFPKTSFLVLRFSEMGILCISVAVYNIFF